MYEAVLLGCRGHSDDGEGRVGVLRALLSTSILSMARRGIQLSARIFQRQAGSPAFCPAARGVAVLPQAVLTARYPMSATALPVLRLSEGI